MEGSAVLSRDGAARPRRASRRAPFVQRYWAFLSYSHADAAEAAWLHGALERFQVPPELVGRRTERFLIPKTLAPVFRDRSELAASTDLGQEIREAIECSRHLIVLCSPAAAASRWVNEEIRTFKRIRPDGEVLAAVLSGVPNASAVPGREAEECFPPALREKYDARGRPTGEPAEPIAADLREEADGRQGGLLKLVAGMLDLRLDDLVQREEVRRNRRMVLVTAAAIAGMALTSTLAVTAIQARDAARDQRREAESLVGFMIGDLKDKLEPVGRLDALDAVGARVLGFYERQDKGDLSDEALAQRSRALTLMGDIAQRKGDLDRALRLYREGLAGTAEALRRDPDNPQRLFDHAQNVYYIGAIAMQRSDRRAALRHFGEYKALADRMIALDPRDPRWQLEAAYADHNVGAVLSEERKAAEAAELLGRSLARTDRLLARDAANGAYLNHKVETLAFLADAMERSGRLVEAARFRDRQLGMLSRQMAADPRDTGLQDKAMVAHQAAARLRYFLGDNPRALAHAGESVRLSAALLATEPQSAEWMSRSTGAQQVAADLLLRLRRSGEAAPHVGAACRMAETLVARDSAVAHWQAQLARCGAQRARLALAGGQTGEALLQIGQSLAILRSLASNRVEDRLQTARMTKFAGDIQFMAGDRQGAQRLWLQSRSAWPQGIGETPDELNERADLLARLGDTAGANRLRQQLGAMGYRARSIETRA